MHSTHSIRTLAALTLRGFALGVLLLTVAFAPATNAQDISDSEPIHSLRMIRGGVAIVSGSGVSATVPFLQVELLPFFGRGSFGAQVSAWTGLASTATEVSVTGSYHYDAARKLDLYGQTRLGRTLGSEGASGWLYAAEAGANYWFGQRLGANAHAGYVQNIAYDVSFLQFGGGLSFKF